MHRQPITKQKLFKFLNREIKSQVGEACSVGLKHIGSHPEDEGGCNWSVTGWFHSSRPSADDYEAIFMAAVRKLQRVYKLA